MDGVGSMRKRIRQLRKANKMTQKQLANIAGVSTNSIIAYEKGTSPPPLDALIRIAQHFKTSLDHLCGVNINIENHYRVLVKSLMELHDLTKFKLHSSDQKNLRVKTCIEFGNSEASNPIVKFLNNWEQLREIHANEVISDATYKTLVEEEITKLPDM